MDSPPPTQTASTAAIIVVSLVEALVMMDPFLFFLSQFLARDAGV
jgi:hypothetical protein